MPALAFLVLSEEEGLLGSNAGQGLEQNSKMSASCLALHCPGVGKNAAEGQPHATGVSDPRAALTFSSHFYLKGFPLSTLDNLLP